MVSKPKIDVDPLIDAMAHAEMAVQLIRNTPGAIDDPIIHACCGGLVREAGALKRRIIEIDQGG